MRLETDIDDLDDEELELMMDMPSMGATNFMGTGLHSQLTQKAPEYPSDLISPKDILIYKGIVTFFLQ